MASKQGADTATADETEITIPSGKFRVARAVALFVAELEDSLAALERDVAEHAANPNLLETEGAALYIHTSADWLHKSRRDGSGPAFVKLGRGRMAKVLYTRQALDEFLAACARQSLGEVRDAG